MSPTPILDRLRPAPTPLPVSRARSFITAAVVGGAVLYLQRQFLTGDGSTLLWMIAGLVPILFVGVLLHELGHFAAGLLVNFELRRILVGPWRVSKESQGYRLRFVRGRFLAGGYTFVTPRSAENLRRRFAVFAAGGPAVTALLFLPIALLPRGPFATLLLIVNLLLACSSWLPMEIQGTYTDGKIILTLLRGGPAADRLAAVLYLMTLDGSGIQPCDWPANALAGLGAPGGGRTYRAAGRIFLHLHARQTAPPAQAAAALDQVLELAGEISFGLRRRYFAEAAFWQGIANRNAAMARAWLAEARAVKGAAAEPDWDAAPLAAIAMAEGNRPEFRQYLDRAVAYLDRQPGPSGSVAAYRAQLVGLSDLLLV